MWTTTARTSGDHHRRLFAYHRDGLLDLFLGTTLIAAAPVVGGHAGLASEAPLLMLCLLLLAKSKLTARRIGPDELAGERPPVGPEWLALRFTLLLLVVAGMAVVTVLPQARGWIGNHLWETVAFVALVVIAVEGLRVGAVRFAVYAVLCAAGLAAAIGHGAPTMSSLLTGLGGIISAGGLLLLVRFLESHPLPTPSRS